MRRLYILPKSVWSGEIQTGTHTLPDGSSGPVMLRVTQLFHPRIGSHYIDLPQGLVLMMTSFDHDERAEDLFHAHPEVAILPHPTLDGHKPLQAHVGAPGYKFTQTHLDALTAHAALGASATDTVLDLARKASAIHPEVRFRNVL
jgi:hypothetical protein